MRTWDTPVSNHVNSRDGRPSRGDERIEEVDHVDGRG